MAINTRTLYRRLKKLEGHLLPIIEKDRGLYWLRGYAQGKPDPIVVIPRGTDDKLLKIYLKLGWEPHKFDEKTDSVVLLARRAISEPDEDLVPSEFRLYRELVLSTGCTPQTVNEKECSKYFREICKNCSAQPYRAPTLKELCPKCKEIGSYELVKQQLQILGIQPKPSRVLAYLSYEYRKEMFVVIDQYLREAFVKGDLALFHRRRTALRNRCNELVLKLFDYNTFDASLENKLSKAIFQFAVLPAADAEKAIRITLNCARWHQLDMLDPEAKFFDLYEKAAKEYEVVARPMLDKALFTKLP